MVKVLILFQQVTVLMVAFTPAELQEATSEEKNTILREVHEYNRRFSGQPRTVSPLLINQIKCKRIHIALTVRIQPVFKYACSINMCYK